MDMEFWQREKFRFYLGAPSAAWLWTYPISAVPELENPSIKWPDIPLFVSRRQMPKKYPKRAVCNWAMDSGGFTELQSGRWSIDAKQYAKQVEFYAEKVGRIQWVCQQDWMCEPVVIEGGHAYGKEWKGTKLSVSEHQKRTVQNFLELRDLISSVTVIPVIQGWQEHEYHDCIDMFQQNGIDLSQYDTVGVGSVCMRQATDEAASLIRSIAGRGISIHGFGLHAKSLSKIHSCLVSSDSMAWSRTARWGDLNRCDRPVKNCANCWHAAEEWYHKQIGSLDVQNHQAV